MAIKDFVFTYIDRNSTSKAISWDSMDFSSLKKGKNEGYSKFVKALVESYTYICIYSFFFSVEAFLTHSFYAKRLTHVIFYGRYIPWSKANGGVRNVVVYSPLVRALSARLNTLT